MNPTHIFQGWCGSGTAQINDPGGPTPISASCVRTQKRLHSHFRQHACALFSPPRFPPAAPPHGTALTHTRQACGNPHGSLRSSSAFSSTRPGKRDTQQGGTAAWPGESQSLQTERWFRPKQEGRGVSRERKQV